MPKTKQKKLHPNDHPERQSDEVYIGNFSDEDAGDGTGRTDYECIGWKTKRKGKIAYDTHGKSFEEMFPVFVQRSEIDKKDPRITKRLLPEA